MGEERVADLSLLQGLHRTSTSSGGCRLRPAPRPRRAIALIGSSLATALVLGGCGSHSPSAAPPTAETCHLGAPGPAPLRRLTRFELARTLADVLGADPRVVEGLPPDERSADEFDNNAAAYSVSAAHASAWLDMAEGVATKFFAAPDAATVLIGCDPASGDAGCLARFIATVGARLFRRPLTEDEHAAFLALATATQDDVPTSGPSAVLTAMLQSASFLYRPEAPPSGIVAPLGSDELATRLGYLLTETAPDNTLIAAAASGALAEDAGLLAETDRLLATSRAAEAFAHFVSAWWELDGLAATQKDSQLFRLWSPDINAAWSEETRLFLDDLWHSGPTLEALFTSPRTFVDPILAGLYGDPAPTDAGFGLITREGGKAVGLFTQGSFLATHAKANQTSPVLRGKFVRARLLCTPPPPPPADRVIVPPAVDPRLATRARFAAHASDPFCAGCHKQMDPLGFAFEHFDAIGRWRDTDAGEPIDATGGLTDTDVDGPFDGVAELARRLAASADVRTCVATQWFRWAFGRDESSDDDLCAIDTLSAALRDNHGDLRSLARATVLLPGFRQRGAASPPSP